MKLTIADLIILLCAIAFIIAAFILAFKHFF